MDEPTASSPSRDLRLTRRSVRLGVAAVLLALAPLALLARLTTSRAQQAVRAEVGARLRATTDMSGRLVVAQIGSVAHVLESEAHHPRLVRSVAGGDPARFDDDEIAFQLTALVGSGPGLAGAGLADLSGVLRGAPASPQLIGQDFSHRDWYKGLVAKGSTYVSEAFESAQEGHPLVVTISTYVRAASTAPGAPGEPRAIVLVGVELTAVQAIADDAGRRQGVRLWVTDQRDKIIATAQGRPRGLRSIADEPIGRAASVPPGRLIEMDDGAQSMLVAHKPVDPLGWTVFAGVPRSAAYAGVVAIRNTMLAIAIPLGLIVFAGIVMLVRLQRRQWRVEAALETARDAAHDASRQKARFLANMSHEIRTPLNAVIGMTSLLSDTGLDAEQREFVDTVRSSGDHLLTIINDILDFSKIDAGRLELERYAFSLRECVEESLDIVAVRASEKGLDLGYIYAPGTPEGLEGDAGRIRQILLNLLSNAVKFTGSGEVMVEISASAGTTRDHLIQIDIRDTGVGMSSAETARLFKPFAQLDASVTRTPGTGLGLVISQRLAQAMGGDVTVDTRRGEGSVFRVTIEADGAELPAPAMFADATKMAGLRALVVDDRPANLRILDGYLRRWGIFCVMETDPQAALGRVRRGESFDLALLDLHMPEMDGVQLASAIKEASQRGPKLVLISSAVPEEHHKDLFEAEVRKPIKPSKLFDVLAGVLHIEGVAVAPGARPPSLDSTMASRIPLRVLVVEDNSVNQKVAQAMLSRLGYQADVVGNGVEAIQAVSRQPYDVVLMDVQMPDMDGLAATVYIRRAMGDRAPRIVGLTANATVEDRELCISSGMDDYMSKPVTVEKIAEALRATGERTAVQS